MTLQEAMANGDKLLSTSTRRLLKSLQLGSLIKNRQAFI
jgi:hypothetical protein